MTTKPVQPSGDDPGPEPADRTRTPSGTSSATGLTAAAGDPVSDQLKELVLALKVLPRRLARQRLGDDEKYHVPQFDAFYAAMMGASNIINGRTAQLPYHPATTAHWTGWPQSDEAKVRFDTRLVDIPHQLNKITAIRLDIGHEHYEFPAHKPHRPIHSPRIENRRLYCEVPVPEGAGPFKVEGFIEYAGSHGKQLTARVFTTVARHRLALPPVLTSGSIVKR